MEKEDGEALAILRARHERAILEIAEHVRVRPAAGGDQIARGAAQVARDREAALRLLRAPARPDTRRDREGGAGARRARSNELRQDELRDERAGARAARHRGRHRAGSRRERRQAHQQPRGAGDGAARRGARQAAIGRRPRQGRRVSRADPDVRDADRADRRRGVDQLRRRERRRAVQLLVELRQDRRREEDLRGRRTPAGSAATRAASRTGRSRATSPPARSRRSSSSCARRRSARPSPSSSWRTTAGRCSTPRRSSAS